MKLAARVTDFHACPMLNPDESPHVGGPIATGEPSVMIGNLPAARIYDFASCVGPPDLIAQGSRSVFIGWRAAARVTDRTVHGGIIVRGCGTVLIGDTGSGGFGGANTPSGAAAKRAKKSRAAMRRRALHRRAAALRSQRKIQEKFRRAAAMRLAESQRKIQEASRRAAVMKPVATRRKDGS